MAQEGHGGADVDAVGGLEILGPLGGDLPELGFGKTVVGVAKGRMNVHLEVHPWDPFDI